MINDEIVDFWLKQPSADIQRIITAKRRSPTQEKIDQLWRTWFEERSATLEPVLLELGIPAAEQSTSVPSKWKLGVEVRLRGDQGTVRRAWRWMKDKDAAIRGGLLKTLRQLPDDEQLNNEIFQAWLEHQSGELEELIKAQGRKPADTKLEALFYLVTGQPKQYQVRATRVASTSCKRFSWHRLPTGSASTRRL